MPDFGDVPDPTTGRYANFGAVNPNDPSVANGRISPTEWEAYQRSRRRAAWIGGLTTVGGMLTAGPLSGVIGGPAAAAGMTAGTTASTGAAGMTGQTGIGIANILADLFGNLFGAKIRSDATNRATDTSANAQIEAARLQKLALDEALAYQKQLDERDYRDWLARENRDRQDWEATEQRRAPYRALGDSAIRTLADYIRVPGMRPAQDVPVQVWRNQGPGGPTAAPPVNTTMPIEGGRTIVPAQAPESGGQPISAPLGWHNTADPRSLLAKYGRALTARDLMRI